MKSLLLAQLVNRMTQGHFKLGWWSSPWRSDQSPIFAGGASRSGTTLLYSILGSHSRLYIARESALLSGNRDLNHLSRRLEVPESAILPVYRRSCCAAEFTQELLTGFMREKGKVRWGDKTPRNVLWLEDFFRWFPKGRFIHMIRDGRDVVCSLRTHKPAFKKDAGPEPVENPWADCVNLWVTWTREGLAWRGDPRYYELRYEDLVSQPEVQIKELLKWLGEPWEENLLLKVRQEKVSRRPDVSQPITRASVERWRHDLPVDARATFEPEGCRLLRELGYATDDAWLREMAPVG